MVSPTLPSLKVKQVVLPIKGAAFAYQSGLPAKVKQVVLLHQVTALWSWSANLCYSVCAHIPSQIASVPHGVSWAFFPFQRWSISWLWRWGTTFPIVSKIISCAFCVGQNRSLLRILVGFERIGNKNTNTKCPFFVKLFGRFTELLYFCPRKQ